MNAVISGIGVYIPDNILTNAELEKIVDTSDEWITERTGIRERRIVPKDSDMVPSDLGVKAALIALDNAGLKPEDIDGIIAAGLNPDKQWPAMGCILQKKLGTKGFAYDVTAACSGFVVAYNTASLMIKSGQCKNMLVIGAELISRILDWNDRNTCVLFGDGAGAVVLSATEDQNRGTIDSILESRGESSDILYLDNLNSNEDAKLKMDGKQVFKIAVKSLSDVVLKVLEKNNYSVDDLKLAVFHQANIRILNKVADRIGLPHEKVIVNVNKYGNTSSASIPLALNDAVNEGRLEKGDLVVFAAIGGGMVWGCNLIKW